MRLLLVCVGGALGTGARFLLGGWAARTFGPAFPFGTLIINSLGSFLIMLIMGLSLEKGLIPADARLFLTTGMMGGFTTYSTFNYETIRLFADGSTGFALLYLGGTVFGCLAAGLLAFGLLRLLP